MSLRSVFIFLFLCVELVAEAQLTKADAYNRIDNVIYSYSKRPSQTFDSVAAFVNKTYTASEDRTRAYYTWIALNVHYDMERIKALSYLRLGNFQNASDLSEHADTVFRRKKAVCEGFSKLMNKFCKASSIPSVMVVGYTKMPDGELDTTFLHAWNAVRIDSAWQLVDVTWSNGYLSPVKGYIKRFSDKYFLCPPSEFVKDHLPLDPMWQLLDPAISKKSFFSSDSMAPEKSVPFRYNDSIRAYMALGPKEREYADFLHYHHYDPSNSIYTSNLDIHINNLATDNLMSASIYYDEFADFYNNTLIKQPTVSNCKKAKKILEDAKSYNDKALGILKSSTAYTSVYKEKLTALLGSTKNNEATIAKGLAGLADIQKSLSAKKTK